MIAQPLLTMPGLPAPAGTFSLRANSSMSGLAAPMVSSANAAVFLGLTNRLGINVTGDFTRAGGFLTGFWNQLSVEGQYTLSQAADRSFGLSVVGGLEATGSRTGLNILGFKPAVGLRALTTLGVTQANLGALYRPGEGRIDYSVGLVVQASSRLAPSLDIVASIPLGGGGATLGLAPGIQFGLSRTMNLGLGYVIPVRGAPPSANQFLAHLQLGL